MAARVDRTLLIVSLPGNLPLVASAFKGHARIQGAADPDAALRLCTEHRPDVVLVGYHFDEMRPYRVIRALRSDPCGRACIFVLFCMLPVEGSDLDGQTIRETYQAMGCREFVDLRKEASVQGADAALAKLRDAVLPYLT